MDSTFTVRQHFYIDQGKGSDDEALELLLLVRDQLFELAIQHITGTGMIYMLELKIDGELTLFGAEDKLVSYELQESLLKILAASRVEVTADYYYEALIEEDLSQDEGRKQVTLSVPFHPAGPMFLDLFLNNASSKLLEKLEFTYYLEEDLALGSGGILIHYDKEFQGMVDDQILDQIPGDFVFTNSYFPVYIDSYPLEPQEEKQVLIQVEKLRELTSDDYFFLEDGVLSFHILDMDLKNNEELDKFIYHTSKLIELLQPNSEDDRGTFITLANFIDFSKKKPKLLHIDFDEEGNYEMHYTAV